MLVPVSPSGTGYTLRSLIDSRWAARASRKPRMTRLKEFTSMASEALGAGSATPRWYSPALGLAVGPRR